MKLTTDAQKQAYSEIMKLIEDAQNSINISGKNFSQTNADRLNAIAVGVIALFKKDNLNANIRIEQIEQNKPFNAVHVEIDSFELDSDSKSDFVELIQLADNIVFNAEKDEKFLFSFFVNDIWTEEN